MRVIVDAEKCIASGACVLACPQVFAQDEDGIVVVLEPRPDPSLHEQVREAVAACPAAVIEAVGQDDDQRQPAPGPRRTPRCVITEPPAR